MQKRGELLRKALLVRTSIVLRCAVILVGRTIVVLLYCLLVRTSVLPSGEMSAPVIQKRGRVARCSE